jgi:uncharacterized protein
MFKKPFIIIGLIGILLLIGGLLFNQSLIGSFASDGRIKSITTLTVVHIIQLLLLTLGVITILVSVFFNLIPKERRQGLYLIAICIFGLVVIVIGVFSSPAFFHSDLIPVQRFDNDYYRSLYNSFDRYTNLFYSLQLVLITAGCLVFLISFLLFIRKSLKLNWVWSFLSIFLVLIIYLSLLYVYIFNKIYTNNILLTDGVFNKVFDLVAGRDLLHSEFDPEPMLVVARKEITKAKYPVIDINFHLNSSFQTDYDRIVLKPDNLVRSMDSVGVKILVNTDGYWGGLERYAEQYPDRFINFYPTGFRVGIMTNEDLADLPHRFEKAVKKGAHGNGELWKNLGLKTRDENGKVIPVDDPRLDPLWAKGTELNVPFIWHLGDPAAFYHPVNKHNERYEELGKNPAWSVYGERFPKREEVLKQRENVFKKHPGTIFIGAHFGMTPENLEYTGYLLDTYPNYFIELSSVLSDLGRQPYTAREFFIKYQDRILFGTDGGNNFGEKGWTVEKYYQTYFEFLETDNEYFSYPLQEVVNQGKWKIHGINLPDSVLEKVYYKNAEKILFPLNKDK